VVLNWHGRAETLQCLHALAALSYPNLAVILIDNDCREFTADELSQLVANGRYVSTEVNLGFAAGANLGMRYALEAGRTTFGFSTTTRSRSQMRCRS